MGVLIGDFHIFIAPMVTAIGITNSEGCHRYLQESSQILYALTLFLLLLEELENPSSEIFG